MPALANNEKGEAMKCLYQHNQLIAATKKLTIGEKFSFTVDFLTEFGNKEQVKQFSLKRQEFIENPENAEVYLSMLMTEWALACVKNAPLSVQN